MLHPRLIGVIALAFATLMSGAQAFDETKYPDLAGQWTRRVIPGLGGQPSHDQTKPWGFGQHAPLTPEYTKIWKIVLRTRPKAAKAITFAALAANPSACR
jgi:hypothetical protein